MTAAEKAKCRKIAFAALPGDFYPINYIIEVRVVVIEWYSALVVLIFHVRLYSSGSSIAMSYRWAVEARWHTCFYTTWISRHICATHRYEMHMHACL